MFSIPRWLGFAGPALTLALAVSCVLLWSSNGALKTKLEAAQSELANFVSLARVQETALRQKDAAIQQQSASIDALQAAARINRQAYDELQKTAKVSAEKHQIAAAQLMALKGPEGELAQCRAARDLLEQELVP